MEKILREMKVDDTGIVVRVDGGGELAKRIRDMGVVPGSEIVVVGRAPLYDPVAIKVKGTVMTLRNSEADHIIVKEID